jgi:hypothetical protein
MTDLNLYSPYLSDYAKDYKKFKISKFSNKNVYIPAIGKIDPNKYYSLDKNLFYKTRLYIGNNLFQKIGNNIYIRFEGEHKFFNDDWFISTIKKVKSTYKKLFGEIKPLYFQIVQVKNKFKGSNYGGIASINAVEIVCDCSNLFSNKNRIKWIIAHEFMHLYFPSLSNKYQKKGVDYDEGLVDWLSLYFNFTDNQIERLYRETIENFKRIDKLKDKEYYNHKMPYINGLFLGYNLSKSKLNKLINFIKQYNINRKYLSEKIDDIDFVKELGFYNNKYSLV